MSRAPGDTAFTVIPCSSPCRASDNVADHTAALAAPYPIAPPPGMRSSSATSETVFTMRPRPCVRRCGHAARIVPIVPVKFTANTRSSCSAVIDSIAPAPAAPPPASPALFTTMSSCPNVSTARATGCAAPANVEMSL